MKLSHIPVHIRLALTKHRFSRLLHSNWANKIRHPNGWEPEVLKCLCAGKWNGPVWDVGAYVGRLAYRVSQHHKIYCFEPNLHALQFLGYNLRNCPNVVVVPFALTLDGQPMPGSVDPDFLKVTGPKVATLSVTEALQKFGRPGVIKIDIEGGEYALLESGLLRGIPLLIEWHREIPQRLPDWDITTIDPAHSLLTPRAA